MTGRVADALEERGYAVVPNWLPEDEASRLARHARTQAAAGVFVRAGVGRSGARQIADAVRGDSILWIDDAAPVPPPVAAALARLDALRATLNAALYLGLVSLEAHFAHYPPGASYRMHVDRFRDDDTRVLSVVLYLNEGWSPADGGRLRLYLERAGEAPYVDVLPEGGTLVTFLADRFAHEVLPARRERLSLTGWFRRRAVGG